MKIDKKLINNIKAESINRDDLDNIKVRDQLLFTKIFTILQSVSKSFFLLKRAH
jgi:hypothetical protein